MATFHVIKAARDGNFQGGVVRLGLKERAVGFSVDNYPGGVLPADILQKLAQVDQLIASGVPR